MGFGDEDEEVVGESQYANNQRDHAFSPSAASKAATQDNPDGLGDRGVTTAGLSY